MTPILARYGDTVSLSRRRAAYSRLGRRELRSQFSLSCLAATRRRCHGLVTRENFKLKLEKCHETTAKFEDSGTARAARDGLGL